MAFALHLAEQLARPNGRVGTLLGKVMDIANRTPTRMALELLAPKPGETILDAGCGTGAAMARLLSMAPCSVTGIDPSPVMLSAARRRLGDRAKLISTTVEDMPFEEGCFDAILALNMLYFSDPQGRMIDRMRRSLKPGGRLIAYVTDRQSMENWAFARMGIHQLYDQETLQERLISGGFASDRITVHLCPITRKIVGLLAHAQR